jgi:hypothetical protein
MTFWPAYKAMRSIAAGQNVAEKNPTKGAARLGFFVAQNAVRHFAYTDLLCDVKSATKRRNTDVAADFFIWYQLWGILLA